MIILTHNATRQAQRRGATQRSVELAAEFGSDTRASDGCFLRVLTDRAGQRALRLYPLGVHEIQRALGTAVMTEENERGRIVVDVLPTRREVGVGRYRRHHRLAAHGHRSTVQWATSKQRTLTRRGTRAFMRAKAEAIAAARNRTLIGEPLLQLPHQNASPAAKGFAHNRVPIRYAIVVDETGWLASLAAMFATLAPLPHDPRVAEDGYDAASTDTLAEELTQRYETAVQ